MIINARFINREKIRRRFIALGRIAEQEVRAAMEKEAAALVETQRRVVAKDDGDLQRSIIWRWVRAARNALMTIEISAGGKVNGKTVWWARLVEFGTAPHRAGGRFAGAHHPGTRPQPFFFPVWRARRKRIKSAVRRALKRAIVKSRNA